MDGITKVIMDELGADEYQADGLRSWVFDSFGAGDEEQLRQFIAMNDARLYRSYDEYIENEDPDDDNVTIMEDDSYGVIVWNN